MKQIIVTKEVVYSYNTSAAAITNIKEINTLETGSLAIFTEEGVLVTAANMATVLDDVKKCYFAVGNQQSTATAKALISMAFPRAGQNVRYSKSAYVAPVKQKKFVGNDGSLGSLNLPTAAAGNIFAMKIINTTPGLRTMGAVEGREVFNYEVVQKSGEANTAVITRLIALINADPDRIVNAVVVGSQVGFSLETTDASYTFSIALDEALLNANVYQAEGTVSNSVAITFGVGTSDQVLALEDLYSTARGNTNRIHLPQFYYTNPSLVVAGETYNLYTIEWDGERSEAMEGRQSTKHFTLIVAVPNGTALATSFETIMAEVFGGVYSTSDIETGL